MIRGNCHASYDFYQKDLNSIFSICNVKAREGFQSAVFTESHGIAARFVEYTLMYHKLLSNNCAVRYFY